MVSSVEPVGSVHLVDQWGPFSGALNKVVQAGFAAHISLQTKARTRVSISPEKASFSGAIPILDQRNFSGALNLTGRQLTPLAALW